MAYFQGNMNYKFLKNIYIFGKNIELCYKGKNKKNSHFGSFLTILYDIIYLAFFLYKFNKNA